MIKERFYMTKKDYVLKNCEFFEDENGLFLATEGIVGTFSGRAFGGENHTKEMCLEEVVNYFDSEYSHTYEDKGFPHSLVQFALQGVNWGLLQ